MDQHNPLLVHAFQDTAIIPILVFFMRFMRPLGVLAAATLICFSYEKCKDLDVSPTIRQYIVNVHALATEGCQLLLVVLAIVNTAGAIEDLADVIRRGDASATVGAVMIEVCVVGSFALHWWMVQLVDMAEACILLQRIEGGGPECEPFLLTRSCLSSLFGHRQKLPSKPGTQATSYMPLPSLPERNMTTTHKREEEIELWNKEASIANRLEALEYLDLVGVIGPPFLAAYVKPELMERLVRMPPVSRIAATTTTSGSKKVKQRTGLLTLPRSNELKHAKRVKWDLGVSENR